MPRQFFIVFVLVLSCSGAAISAEAPAAPASSAIQQGFNSKYKDYLNADSQMLLPFPKLEMAAWKKIQEGQQLRKVYSEPGKYYNNKVYTFTLYQAADDGAYYLEAKGGFWGMDELVYGPLEERDLH